MDELPAGGVRKRQVPHHCSEGHQRRRWPLDRLDGADGVGGDGGALLERLTGGGCEPLVVVNGAEVREDRRQKQVGTRRIGRKCQSRAQSAKNGLEYGE